MSTIFELEIKISKSFDDIRFIFNHFEVVSDITIKCVRMFSHLIYQRNCCQKNLQSFQYQKLKRNIFDIQMQIGGLV